MPAVLSNPNAFTESSSRRTPCVNRKVRILRSRPTADFVCEGIAGRRVYRRRRMSKIFRVLWIFAGASTLPLSEAVAAQNQTILTNHPVELRETISPQGFVHPGRLVEGESIRQISSGHSGDSCRVLRGREPLDPADPASARGNGVVPGCEPLLLSPTATS